MRALFRSARLARRSTRQFVAAEAGFTLVETTIILTMLAVLAAAAAPVASRTIDRAKLTRARGDAVKIKNAMLTMLDELTQFNLFTTDGTNNGPTVYMLVSDGDTPLELGPDGDARWQNPVDDLTGQVDFFERHLITNNPGGDVANDYPTTGVNPWRGPYLLGPVDADPWGNRYASNVRWIKDAPKANDVVVLSAGPDERINSAWERDGLTPGDDDIVIIVLRDQNGIVP
jgi:type II secretory pathway pseudopilin PulG